MRIRSRVGYLVVSLVTARAGWAQVPPPQEDPEVVSLRTEFEHGKYEDVLERANSRINRGNLSEQELTELHKLAGLSAFYLKKMPQAESHLVAVIKLDPDYSLDPFLVAPSAIRYFEKLRSDHSGELEAAREQRRLRAERLRRVAEDRERTRREAEEQRRRIEQLSNRVTVERVETRSYVVNFLPFGAGQFQQGRTQLGIIFAATEGVLAVTSIIAYFAYSAEITDRTTTLNGFVGNTGSYSFTETGIPVSRWRHANAWRITKYTAGGGFWLTYAIGVVDALLHHKDQVVTRTVVEAPVEPTPTPPRQEAPKARLIPAPGGVGAGLSLTF